MDQFVEGKNPYVILGLEKGKDSSLDVIKKAYRRLALVKHPDKAKTPNAAQEFDELKKAYAILSDKSARGALDEYLDAQAAREARLNRQDAKRQRLREDLERKEKEGTKAKNEEEQARAKLKVELESLRARAVQEQQQRHAMQQAEKAAAQAAAATRATSSAGQGTAAPGAADISPDDETTQLLLRTVKVTWDPDIGTYTTDRLREIFSATWLVEDVILKDSKKKKKASALVVLSSPADAQQAAQQVHGDLDNPLLVVPYLKVMPGHQQQANGRPAEAAGGKSPAAVAAADESTITGAGTSKRPLFSSGLAGATSRPAQRPNKPLFPGAMQQANPAETAGAAEQKYSSFPSGPSAEAAAQQPAATSGSFTSFPSMPVAQHSAASGSKFSSFPSINSEGTTGSRFSSFPAAAGSNKGGGIPVGRGYEDAVLGKLQQKATSGSHKDH